MLVMCSLDRNYLVWGIPVWIVPSSPSHTHLAKSVPTKDKPYRRSPSDTHLVKTIPTYAQPYQPSLPTPIQPGHTHLAEAIPTQAKAYPAMPSHTHLAQTIPAWSKLYTPRQSHTQPAQTIPTQTSQPKSLSNSPSRCSGSIPSTPSLSPPLLPYTRVNHPVCGVPEARIQIQNRTRGNMAFLTAALLFSQSMIKDIDNYRLICISLYRHHCTRSHKDPVSAQRGYTVLLTTETAQTTDACVVPIQSF